MEICIYNVLTRGGGRGADGFYIFLGCRSPGLSHAGGAAAPQCAKRGGLRVRSAPIRIDPHRSDRRARGGTGTPTGETPPSHPSPQRPRLGGVCV